MEVSPYGEPSELDDAAKKLKGEAPEIVGRRLQGLQVSRDTNG